VIKKRLKYSQTKNIKDARDTVTVIHTNKRPTQAGIMHTEQKCNCLLPGLLYPFAGD